MVRRPIRPDGGPPDEPAATHGDPRRIRAVYDTIGEHFAETRPRPWPAVVEFATEMPTVETALDVGCGNGRHADLLADRASRVVCLDVSRTVLATARRRLDGGTLVQGDATALPLADGTIEVALSVATIHHLPDRPSRVACLDELARVLVSDGPALVSVWATTHDRFHGHDEGFDTTVDWTLPDGRTIPRFYHIYAPAEFAADLSRSRLVVDRLFEEAGNCYGIVRGPP